MINIIGVALVVWFLHKFAYRFVYPLVLWLLYPLKWLFIVGPALIVIAIYDFYHWVFDVTKAFLELLSQKRSSS